MKTITFFGRAIPDNFSGYSAIHSYKTCYIHLSGSNRKLVYLTDKHPCYGILTNGPVDMEIPA